MKQSDLLKRSLEELKLFTHGEKCDHSVNICFCETFKLISDIKVALKQGERRKTVRAKRPVQQSKCKIRARYSEYGVGIL